MNKALRLVASLALVSAMVVVARPSAAQTTRTLTVTPDTDLLDGDVVALHGTGFTPSAAVFFCQGVAADVPDPSNCGVPYQSAQADASGEFSANYTVRRFMTPASVGTTIDCAQASANCVLGASDFLAPTPGFALAPITFAPQPPRTLTVTPSTDLLDGDVVVVHGTGFTPSQSVDFCQGVDESPVGFEDCGAPAQSAQADGLGEFSADYAAQRFIAKSFGNGVMIDCAAPSASCAMNFIAPSGLGAVPITFAPQPPVPQISGAVTDANGGPLAGAYVWVYTPSDTWVGSLRTMTDSQGSYAFAQAAPGLQYRILFGRPGGSSLASEWFDDQPSRTTATAFTLSNSAQFIVADAQLEQAGTVSGTVTDPNGNPVAGVQVWAYGPSDTWVGSNAASTATDGTYLMSSVRPNDYRVLFRSAAGSGLVSEWFDDAARRSSATVVTVSPGQTVTGINAQLASGP